MPWPTTALGQDSPTVRLEVRILEEAPSLAGRLLADKGASPDLGGFSSKKRGITKEIEGFS